MKNKRLGKGLQALISSENEEESVTGGVKEISLLEITPNRAQPRKHFDEAKLQELAQSIREHGVLQPIVISKAEKGYQIIAGERRYRAAQLAGLDAIPAFIKEVEADRSTEIALIENIQRENLNPIEEAVAYKELFERFGLTQEEMAKRLGKSRPYIANMLRLLTLPSDIQELVVDGTISNGHARALAGIKDEKAQRAILEQIIASALSVRQTEELIKALDSKAQEDQQEAKKSTRKPTSEVQLQIEDRLRSHFGTGVKIKGSGKKGRIEIEYYSDDDLNRILELVLGELNF